MIFPFGPLHLPSVVRNALSQQRFVIHLSLGPNSLFVRKWLPFRPEEIPPIALSSLICKMCIRRHSGDYSRWSPYKLSPPSDSFSASLDNLFARRKPFRIWGDLRTAHFGLLNFPLMSCSLSEPSISGRHPFPT